MIDENDIERLAQLMFEAAQLALTPCPGRLLSSQSDEVRSAWTREARDVAMLLDHSAPKRDTSAEAAAAHIIAAKIDERRMHTGLVYGESGGPANDHDRGAQHGLQAAYCDAARIARECGNDARRDDAPEAPEAPEAPSVTADVADPDTVTEVYETARAEWAVTVAVDKLRERDDPDERDEVERQVIEELKDLAFARHRHVRELVESAEAGTEHPTPDEGDVVEAVLAAVAGHVREHPTNVTNVGGQRDVDRLLARGLLRLRAAVRARDKVADSPDVETGASPIQAFNDLVDTLWREMLAAADQVVANEPARLGAYRGNIHIALAEAGTDIAHARQKAAELDNYADLQRERASSTKSALERERRRAAESETMLWKEQRDHQTTAERLESEQAAVERLMHACLNWRDQYPGYSMRYDEVHGPLVDAIDRYVHGHTDHTTGDSNGQ